MWLISALGCEKMERLGKILLKLSLILMSIFMLLGGIIIIDVILFGENQHTLFIAILIWIIYAFCFLDVIEYPKGVPAKIFKWLISWK
jgi:hypothetical protein